MASGINLLTCGGAALLFPDDSIQSVSLDVSYAGTSTLDTQCDGFTEGSRSSHLEFSASATLSKRDGATCGEGAALESGEFCSWRGGGCCGRVDMAGLAEGVWSEGNDCGGDCASNGGDILVTLSIDYILAGTDHFKFVVSINFNGGAFGAPLCMYCGDFNLIKVFYTPDIPMANLFGVHNFSEIFSDEETSGGACVFNSSFNLTITIA